VPQCVLFYSLVSLLLCRFGLFIGATEDVLNLFTREVQIHFLGSDYRNRPALAELVTINALGSSNGCSERVVGKLDRGEALEG
jgi:hypothetical protein